MSVSLDNLTRPVPPDEIMAITGNNIFLPAPDLMAWIKSSFIDEDGLLFTADHDHLREAEIACLWTNTENMRQGRRIVAQAELGSVGRGNKWSKARLEIQIEAWFGYIPDFLVTFDALFAGQTDDARFCAVVDHELYHCAQATDSFGMPAFIEATGLPKFCLLGHDVEEFVGVIRRFGVEAGGPELVDLFIAGSEKPLITPVKLSEACGTCLRLVA